MSFTHIYTIIFVCVCLYVNIINNKAKSIDNQFYTQDVDEPRDLSMVNFRSGIFRYLFPAKHLCLFQPIHFYAIYKS